MNHIIEPSEALISQTKQKVEKRLEHNRKKVTILYYILYFLSLIPFIGQTLLFATFPVPLIYLGFIYIGITLSIYIGVFALLILKTSKIREVY